MTRSSIFGFAVVLVFLLAPTAWADSITFADLMPSSPSTGVIDASGTFSGSATQITLYAFPPCGGQGGQANMQILCSTWSGAISGLTSGTMYNVVAIMYNSNGDFSTAIVQVTVM
jgi:hypothetical protein